MTCSGDRCADRRLEFFEAEYLLPALGLRPEARGLGVRHIPDRTEVGITCRPTWPPGWVGSAEPPVVP